MYYKLIDEQSGKIKFVGTEDEILEFSAENPSCVFVTEKIEKDELHKYTQYKKKYEVTDDQISKEIWMENFKK